jgi:hypothetical protein
LIPGGLAKQQLPEVSEDDLANRAAMLAKLDAARDDLEAAYTNWASLTDAQRNASLRLLVRVVCGLSRLSVQRYESSGP